MIRKAAEITLTQKARQILERMANATQGELHFKIRATIIIKASEGINNKSISKQIDISRLVAIKWRNRWAYASKLLEKVEIETPHKLLEKVKEVLSDEYRSGSPAKFTPEQVARIIDLSLQNPESVGVPMTHWTIDAIRDKAIDSKIVDSISSRQVERFLKRR